MQTYRLRPHPDNPPRKVRSVSARLVPQLRSGQAMLRFRVEGNSELQLPGFAGRGRKDELWETTCFELFLRRADGSYREFNFSPSGHWAGYDFTSYRAGREDFDPLAWPEISSDGGSDISVCTVFIDARDLLGFETAGLAAVIEEMDGTKSYWAIAHADGQPDFHDPACFATPLVATETA